MKLVLLLASLLCMADQSTDLLHLQSNLYLASLFETYMSNVSLDMLHLTCRLGNVYSLKTATMPQQENGYDCGVYVIGNSRSPKFLSNLFLDRRKSFKSMASEIYSFPLREKSIEQSMDLKGYTSEDSRR